MVECLAAGFRRFKRNGELFLGFRLANEFAEPTRPEFELKTLLPVSAGSAHQSFRGRSLTARGQWPWLKESLTGLGVAGCNRNEIQEACKARPADTRHARYQFVVEALERFAETDGEQGVAIGALPPQRKCVRVRFQRVRD